MKKQLIVSFISLTFIASSISLSAQTDGIYAGLNKTKELTSNEFIDNGSIFTPAALDSLLQTDEYIRIVDSLGIFGGLRRAKELTSKGLIAKESIFTPNALDSLLQCDEYVMLICSFEGCKPCERLRQSNVFELYPITPYYTDRLIGQGNETIRYTFSIHSYPTCIFFDRSGEIVAVTLGVQDRETLDRITVRKEKFCEQKIQGVPDDQILLFINLLHKANIAYLRKDMDNVYKYASEAMEISPTFYGRYLLYKYYLSKNDPVSANKYKVLALENATNVDKVVCKDLISELTGK